MDHIVKIISATYVNHNVKQFDIEKPKGFKFTPGQATDLSINQPEWKDKKNPFTFTCLNDDYFLQFTIKIYKDSEEGVTRHLDELQPGDELIISDAWGAIEYKGPGYFIAGGAGITPFLAILRELFVDGGIEGNTLFFSNKTERDIILASELKRMLGENAHFTTTEDEADGVDHRRINAEFLKAEVKDFKKHFYVCGPDEMVKEITETLESLGASADSVVFEK
jgi:ferredoxin-NADP reductase